jgi:hypothetical protein
MQVRARLLMNDKSIRASILKRLKMTLWLYYHQVNIQKESALSFEGFNYVCAECNRGHKGAVHYIDVKPIRSRFFNTRHLLLKNPDLGS